MAVDFRGLVAALPLFAILPCASQVIRCCRPFGKQERKREREDGRCVVVVVAVVDSVVPRSLVVLDFRPSNSIPSVHQIPNRCHSGIFSFCLFHNPERSHPEVSLSFFLELVAVCLFLTTTAVFFFFVVLSSVLAVFFSACKERRVGAADNDNDGSSTTTASGNPGATMMIPKAKAPAPNQACVSVNEYKRENERLRERERE
jgi:hypothetical protein